MTALFSLPALLAARDTALRSPDAASLPLLDLLEVFALSPSCVGQAVTVVDGELDADLSIPAVRFFIPRLRRLLATLPEVQVALLNADEVAAVMTTAGTLTLRFTRSGHLLHEVDLEVSALAAQNPVARLAA